MRLHTPCIALISLLTFVSISAVSAPAYSHYPGNKEVKRRSAGVNGINATGPSTKIKLANLRGAQLSDAVILQWTVTERDANTNIVVERSTDGSSFTALTSLTSTGSHQAYTDPNPPRTALYRLRFTTKSGAIEYSVPVSFGGVAIGFMEGNQAPVDIAAVATNVHP